MLDLLITAPRLLVGAVIGLLLGLGCAFLIHTGYPELSLLVSSAIVAVALAAGAVLGAAWEARRS